MSLQAFVDGMSAQWMRERAETQLTLGDLIEVLQSMPADAQVKNLINAHSYRGYYSDLAFEEGEGMRPAGDLLSDCRDEIGAVHKGYKGGDFTMGSGTPLWIASYGSCGLKLMAVHAGGEVETQEDD